MGLDMYLTAERYIWSDENGEIDEAINNAGIDTKGMRVKGVRVDAMYWRKANAIHNWFVNVIQDGEDECKPHNVEVEQLRELVALCKDVLAHQDDPEYAAEHLPPMEGFFFGDTGIDEYYYGDLEETIEGLEKFLNDEDFTRRWEFTYRSSW